MLAAGCGAGAAEREAPAPQPAVGLIGHRGASRDAPENTIAAVDLAFAQGAHGVEIDVWLSRDDEVIVFHDETTERFGGSDAPVASQTLAELRALDVGDGQRIPRLADVLARVPEGRTLFVEIKSGVDTVDAVIDVVEAHHPRARGGDVAYEGFDLEVMRAVRARAPRVAVYWVVGARRDPDTRALLPHPPKLAAVAAQHRMTGVAVDYRGVDDAFRAAVAAAGIELYVWTVDDPGEVRRMRDAGARWIETNVPAAAAGALQ
jgi:glycerophosphoryl diester phosphodiesterase